MLTDESQICINTADTWQKETVCWEITHIHQLIAETMNLFIFITFIKLFSAIIAMPEGQMRVEEKPGSGAPLHAGGSPPLPPAEGEPPQAGGKVNCGGHQAESCAACPLVYTHHENPHAFRDEHGHIWCNGECFWRDGMCELKKPGALNWTWSCWFWYCFFSIHELNSCNILLSYWFYQVFCF